MHQLMETGEVVIAGPRHARPVTLKSRLLWALDKGPARWTWKTNLWSMLVVLAILVGTGVAVSLGLLITLAVARVH